MNNEGKRQALIDSLLVRYPGLCLAKGCLEDMDRNLMDMENFKLSNPSLSLKPTALIIDEKIIDFALIFCQKELLNISQKCSTVVCCRARKDQKAKMVQLIKEGKPGTITLGIGDGANDVDMIKVKS